MPQAHAASAKPQVALSRKRMRNGTWETHFAKPRFCSRGPPRHGKRSGRQPLPAGGATISTAEKPDSQPRPTGSAPQPGVLRPTSRLARHAPQHKTGRRALKRTGRAPARGPPSGTHLHRRAYRARANTARTASARAEAVRPYSSCKNAAGPTWPNRSLTPWRTSGIPAPASASTAATASPMPPTTPWFSNTATARFPIDSRTTKSLSSGLTQNMSITSADTPLSASSSAASRASETSWPDEMMSTSEPSRSTFPDPSQTSTQADRRSARPCG